jgi:hypothetical protein
LLIPNEFKKLLPILFDLNDHEFKLFSDWTLATINSTAKKDEPIVGYKDAMAYFILNEFNLGDEKKDKDKDRIYACAVLTELIKETPDPKLLNFLSSEIPYSIEKKPIEITPVVNPETIFNKKVVSAILADNISDEELINLIEESKGTSINSNLLQAQLRKINKPEIQELGNVTESGKLSIKESKLLSSRDEVDLDGAIVYGFVTRVLETGSRFIKPIAVEINDVLICLSKDEVAEFFPNTGNVIWLARDHKKTLQEGQYGKFEVEISEVAQRNQDASTKYCVKKYISRDYN